MVLQHGKHDRPPPAVTPFIWLVVWVAMSAGWLVGFTDGDSSLFIAGFREQFFPALFDGLGLGNPQDRAITNAAPFCTFASGHQHSIHLYLALPHLVAPVGALAAARLSHKHGRKATMWLGCLAFVVGKALLMTSFSMAQIWVARTVTGFAAGLMHQAPLLEVLEVVPFHRRGALASCQALGKAAGFCCASLLAFGLSINDSWGWRLVPIFGIWPALLTVLLLVWLPETPSSLLQRGKFGEARLALQRLRGMLQSTEQEFSEILAASQLGSRSRTQFQAMQQRQCHLALLVALGAVTAMCTTGRGILMTTAFPVFYALGYGRTKGYTMSLVLISFGALLGAAGSVVVADKLGRKRGVMAASVLAAACYIVVAVIIKVVYFSDDTRQLAPRWAWTMGATTGLACAFTYLSDTLLWIFAFEIQPLPTRSLSTGVLVAWQSMQEFVWVLLSLHLLCGMRGWGLFLLFAVTSVLTAVAAWVFLVHTTNTPLETIGAAWSRHWLYKRCCTACKPLAAPAFLSAESIEQGSAPRLQHLAYLQIHKSYTITPAASHGCANNRMGDVSSVGGCVHGDSSVFRAQLMDAAMFKQLSRPYLQHQPQHQSVNAEPTSNIRAAAAAAEGLDPAVASTAKGSQSLPGAAAEWPAGHPNN